MIDPMQPSARDLAVLTRLYRDASRQLAGLVDSTAFAQGRSGVLLAQVDAITKQLGVASDRWVLQATRKQFAAAAAGINRTLGGLGVPIGAGGATASGQFIRIDQRAVGAFAGQIARDLAAGNKQLADSARRVISTTSQAILADPKLSATIAKGLIAGGSLNKIGRSVRQRITDEAAKLVEAGSLTETQLEQIADLKAGYIQAGKRRIKLTEYCNMVAHYQLREAAVESTKLRLAEAGDELGEPDLFDLVVVVGPISGDECDFYVGKVFSLSGRSGEYPPLTACLKGGPPFHPNCTHTIAPFIPRFATAQQRERAQINPALLGVSVSEASRMYRKGPERMYAARREETGTMQRSSRAVPGTKD